MSLLPKHVAIVMDGNGRWAEQKGLPRVAGHRAGLKATRKIIEWCVKNQQIQTLTLFAFSTENWRRPPREVQFLMDLFERTLRQEIAELHQQQIRFKVIGDSTVLNQSLRALIHEAEQLTQHNDKMTLVVALNYGGRWDIIQAARQLAHLINEHRIIETEINEEYFSQLLSTSDLSAPDLLIRTGGEKRLSNFLLWQFAYTELYFSNLYWPDFTSEHFEAALEDYQQRQRRFGGIVKQVSG